MDRRTFLQGTALSSALSAVGATAAPSPRPKARPGSPNILIIMTDQQRYDTIAALGFPHVQTPNLDRLVRE
ncbi:MAG: hypothetical protein L3K26_11630, partial [Candidatus Hydrogenedentes bacterium]|nr:hypothetical protein [Candidatus Hydrogenedentota bacterium]